MSENARQGSDHVNERDPSWVMNSLEADQLAAARAQHYPRRKLKRSEAILFWGLRIYLLFMMGVVCYQVWTTAR